MAKIENVENNEARIIRCVEFAQYIGNRFAIDFERYRGRQRPRQCLPHSWLHWRCRLCNSEKLRREKWQRCLPSFPRGSRDLRRRIGRLIGWREDRFGGESGAGIGLGENGRGRLGWESWRLRHWPFFLLEGVQGVAVNVRSGEGCWRCRRPFALWRSHGRPGGSRRKSCDPKGSPFLPPSASRKRRPRARGTGCRVAEIRSAPLFAATSLHFGGLPDFTRSY